MVVVEVRCLLFDVCLYCVALCAVCCVVVLLVVRHVLFVV